MGGGGGGLDFVSVFSHLFREAERLSGTEVLCGLSGALRPQLTAQRAPSVISYMQH